MSGHVQSIDPKLFIWLIGLIILWVAFITVLPEDYKPEPTGKEVTATFKIFFEGTQITEEKLQVKSGTNAFEAMQEAFSVEYKDYGKMGVMVETINGISPEQGKFWKLFVNGQEAQTGISSLAIKENTLIEWKTEEMQGYTG